MRSRYLVPGVSALLLVASVVEAKHGVHDRLEAIHRRHAEHRVRSAAETESGIAQAAPLQKRGGQCAFPIDAGLVAVTPGQQNAGWAMSPDQPCKPGNYCPYACPPGQVSMQWDPSATSYSYPQSLNGGLFCDNNGNVQKPFPNKPYCQSTATNIGVVNNAGGTVSFCQTVLPGNEAMLIPTAVTDYATLAVPGTDYWAGTAAHYYINPPGVGTGQACVWGTNSNPYGNWSPYVAGTNVDSSGNTFIKLGWNPIYLEQTTPFRGRMPNWGVKIDCPNGGCNGLPCSIDPSQNRVNEMFGSKLNGAGGGAFCVVTVSKGAQANFVVTGGGSSSDSKSSSPPPSSSTLPSSTLSSLPCSSSPTKGGQFYQSTTTPTPPSTTTPISTTTATTTTIKSAPSSTTAWSATTSGVSSSTSITMTRSNGGSGDGGDASTSSGTSTTTTIVGSGNSSSYYRPTTEQSNDSFFHTTGTLAAATPTGSEDMGGITASQTPAKQGLSSTFVSVGNNIQHSFGVFGLVLAFWLL